VGQLGVVERVGQKCGTMVFVPPLLLPLFLLAYASFSSASCTQYHRTRIRRKCFSFNSPILAFQSHSIGHRGSKSRRKSDPLLFNDHGSILRQHQIDPGYFTLDSLEDPERLERVPIPKPVPTKLPHKNDEPLSSTELSRRAVLFQALSISILSTSIFADSASASSEIDTTGELFTPKNEMIKGGGSAAARGIRLKPVEEKEARNRKNISLLKSSGLIQNVYETRFITYLARFLLVFDPAASGWWKKEISKPSSDEDGASATKDDISKEKFAEFAESVEVGLADYFLGPYGSYASVAVAKAGLAAAAPARSIRVEEKKGFSLKTIFAGGKGKERPSKSKSGKRKYKDAQQEATDLARQGILNLFSLLSARYRGVEERQQLAILFSFISKPELQPVQEIRSLLGEYDNGTIATVELIDISSDDEEESNARDFFRLSSRQGGGFSKDDTQLIRVEPPAPLGDEYKPANIQAVMKPTTRILRINVIDGGQGYTVPPEVVIKQRFATRQCEAAAIVDRKGRISEIIVLDPGFGYGDLQARQGLEPALPVVEIIEGRSRKNASKKGAKPAEVIPAKVEPELEYKVVGVDIIDGGSGYLFDEPPTVSVDLPKSDPDWFATPKILGQKVEEDEENQLILASVTEMKSGPSGFPIDTRAVRQGKGNTVLEGGILRSIQKDPIALLPTNTRPQFSKFINNDVIENGFYSIMSLPPVQPEMKLPSSKNYRSIDPFFGGIGKAPVTKNAQTLSSDQYFRLALSGAICTVLVRTALNPLELVKTKIQLKNDKEILELAMKKALSGQETEPTDPESKPDIGAGQVIQTLIEVRGPLSLFQSADITFLASIVFGLFGFGATELFRRSFSAIFFDEAAGPNEFLFLAAAGLATVLTCAAAAPFEILRVRSMSTTENQDVKKVLDDFVEENRQKRRIGGAAPIASAAAAELPTGIQLEDIKPLWSSFTPIVSRELPFAVTKFLVFDLAAGAIANLINSSNLLGDNEIQVGVGGLGLLLSAFAGALAGIAGAFVSHPADLILTLTSASSRGEGEAKDWRTIVDEIIESQGFGGLYAGFPARAVFFFLVIGLQFFLYDYIKTLLDVGTDDLTLVLDVFYAIREGLV